MTAPLEPAADSHDARVRRAQRRLKQLEAEKHRLLAELARLEAAGEDAAAERIEQELLRHEDELDREQRIVADPDEPASSDTVTLASGATLRIDSATLNKAKAASVRSDRSAPPTPALESESRLQDETPSEAAGFALPPPADRQDAPLRKNPPRRRLPVWSVSLLVHAAVLAVLSVAGYAAVGPPPVQLLVSTTQAEEFFDELTEIQFDQLSQEELATEELDAREWEVEAPQTDFAAAGFDLVDFEAPLLEHKADAFNPSVFNAPPTDLGPLAAGVDGADESGGAGEGRAGRSSRGRRGGAQFFGASSRGEGFVFVVDNSGTMKGGRLETTLIEIQRSVSRMTSGQRFHVLFYSDQAYPMFFPDPVEGLVPATRENKQRLAAWLQTVEMCVGGRLIDAMELAESMGPDTVFLLSDGEIGAGTMRYMTGNRDWSFAVNTLGMTVKKPEHGDKLLAIANAHDGLYFPVAVNPLAARMAEQRPIPYHNTVSGPGLVWGTRVEKNSWRSR